MSEHDPSSHDALIETTKKNGVTGYSGESIVSFARRFFRATRLRHVDLMMARVVLTCLLLIAAVDGQSQPPTPRTREREDNPPQSQSTPAQQQPADIRGTEQAPAVIRVLPIPKSQEEAAQEQASREGEASSKRWTIWLAGLTVLVGVGQIFMIWKQARIAKHQNTIMESQSAILEGQSRATEDAAKAAIESGKTLDATLATNKEIERSYISITHRDVRVDYPSDGYGTLDDSKPVALSFVVRIRNSGRTPGDLIGGFFGYLIAPAPGTPDVTRGFRLMTAAFMLPARHLDFGMTIRVTDEPALTHVLRGEGKDRLWLVGVVDYADRFGQKHKGGYGRCLSLAHDLKPVSFNFVPETGPFNYDRRMTPDEEKQYAKS